MARAGGSPIKATSNNQGRSGAGSAPRQALPGKSPSVGHKVMATRTNSVNPSTGPSVKGRPFAPATSKTSQPKGTIGGARAAGTGAKMTPNVPPPGRGLGKGPAASRKGNRS